MSEDFESGQRRAVFVVVYFADVSSWSWFSVFSWPGVVVALNPTLHYEDVKSRQNLLEQGSD
jgi:hypothetical protein